VNSGISKETQDLLDKVVEDRDFDFKEKAKGLKADQIVAFANSGGGVILLGVEDNTSAIVGCGGTSPSEIDEIKRLINAKAASCHPPIPVEIQVENVDAGKPIYKITIQPVSDLCSTAEGVYKKREDGSNVFISPAEIKARVLEIEAEEFTKRLEEAAKHIEEKVERLETIVEELKVKVDETKEAADKAKAVTQDAADVADRFNRDFWDYRGY
jgi:predicted HTH transcriptional regulator